MTSVHVTYSEERVKYIRCTPGNIAASVFKINRFYSGDAVHEMKIPALSEERGCLLFVPLWM